MTGSRPFFLLTDSGRIGLNCGRMRNRSIFNTYLICFAVAVATAACTKKKPTPRNELVAKALQQEYQKSFTAIESALDDVRIKMVFEYAEGRMTSLQLKPQDLSENAERKIEALNGFTAFVGETLQRYSGKKILVETEGKKKKDSDIISDAERAVLENARGQALTLITHYRTVIEKRGQEGFMHHREYLEIAGAVLENAKAKIAALEKDNGIVFSEPLVAKNVLIPGLPKFFIADTAFVNSARGGLSALADLLVTSTESITKTIEALKGRTAVADVMTFHTYDETQTAIAVELHDLSKNVDNALKNYMQELRDAAESPLAQKGKFEVARAKTIPENKGISLKAKYQDRYGDPEGKIAALAHYKEGLAAFIARQEDKSEERIGEFDLKPLNAGEKALLESGLREADRWLEFYRGMQARGDRLTLQKFSEETLKPLVKKQADLEKQIKQDGVDVRKSPISSNEDNQPAWLFDHPVLVDLVRADFDKKKQLGALQKYHDFIAELRLLLAELDGRPVLVAPGKDIVHGERHRLNAEKALQDIDRLIQDLSVK